MLKRYEKKARKQYKDSYSKKSNSATQKTRDKHADTFRKRHKGIGSATKRFDAQQNYSSTKLRTADDRKDNSMTSKSSGDIAKNDLKNLSAEEFKKRYRMSKEEYKQKRM